MASAVALGVLAGGCADPSGGRPDVAAVVVPAPGGAPSAAVADIGPPALLSAGRAVGQRVATLVGPAAPAPQESVIVPPPPTFEAPPEPPAPPPMVLQQPAQLQGVVPTGGTWAVIIGINDYPGGRSDLRSAVNDANDMDLALAGYGVSPERRLVLRDTQASAGMILNAADWLVAHAGPDAVAVFFYSGHVRKVGPTTEAIIASDGNLVSDEALAGRLSRLPARRAWIAIAACYGAGFTELVAPGRVLTGAAPADALAYESSTYGRSYFVQTMVREAMIERRAPATVQAAFLYATTELARRHPGRHPVQIDASLVPLDLRPSELVPSLTGTGSAPAPVVPAVPPVTAPPPPALPPRTCLLILCSG